MSRPEEYGGPPTPPSEYEALLAWRKNRERIESVGQREDTRRSLIRSLERQHEAPRLDLTQFVREVLDGAVGDVDLPSTFLAARFGEAGADGLTDAQRPVFAQLERLVVARAGRALTVPEASRLGLAFVLEWNRRDGSQISFHASDDRYFASDADRRAYDRILADNAARRTARVNQINARLEVCRDGVDR